MSLHMKDLPTNREIVGSAHCTRHLAQLLHTAFKSESDFFTHYTVVRDSDRSCRVLYQRPDDETAALPRSMTSEEIAYDLLIELTPRQARYQAPSHVRQKKGWKVESAEIDGHRAVVVWAEWVEP
jgi:hypothetical protein